MPSFLQHSEIIFLHTAVIRNLKSNRSHNFMPFNVTTLYPKDENSSFDMNHYLTHHVPLFEEIWKSFGLLNWELVEYDTTEQEVKGHQYAVANILTFKDEATWKTALQSPATSKILEDSHNVSNRQPLMFTGNVVARGPARGADK